MVVIAVTLLRIYLGFCMWSMIHRVHTTANNERISYYRDTRPQQPPSSHLHQSSADIKDKITELQCYAKCEKITNSARSHDLHTCLEQCKVDFVKLLRHGFCPSKQQAIFQNISPIHRLSCLDNCSYDFDCPEVQKCCESTCGPVCIDAIGVRDDNLLPPIPKILKCKLPRGHKVEITIQSSANSTYYLHIESRYHIGLMFSPRKLGLWQWQPVEKIAESSDNKSKRTNISFNLRPGRWYQVRVAAINSNGFRGYSEPSSPFTLPHHPKPPKAPTDLKVAAAHFDGKFYRVKIVWCPSKSNLPIEKYKIVWSLYVKTKDESLISSEASVRDTHQFEIMNLMPDSSYYIQVQAMSISGSRRLKSDKFSMLYNTTILSKPYTRLKCTQRIYKHEQPSYSSLRLDSNSNTENQTIDVDGANVVVTKHVGYEARFRLNRKFGMIAQISGFHPYREKVYELCPKDTNCEQREYSAIRAKKDSLEFSKLKYNTTYVLKAYRINEEDTSSTTGSSTFTFTTPKCENFRKRFSKMHIKC